MIIDILSWICLILGSLLGVIGGIGLHRFPDFIPVCMQLERRIPYVPRCFFWDLDYRWE